MMDLNAKQQLAAEHIEGPMLVLAGAGSGKTRVVTCRIAHLLKIGVPSSEILALTFTNKAAEEMRNRIKEIANHYVLTSTFHSLGARILRESISVLGYRSDFTIYDENDSLQLLKNCLGSLGYKDDKGLLKSLRIAISNAKNDLLRPQDLDRDFHSRHDQLLKELYVMYQDKLKEYNALDFDDLLFLTVRLFRESPETLKRYQKRWSFILIDEYQDTNAAQYEMTKLLSEVHNNIFVVGDPDQSIYSWRGANIHNILEFEKDYAGAQVITLEQNYRSTTNILEGANALIEQNEQRYKKELWSDLGAGEKIGVFMARNEQAEAQFVVEELISKTRSEHIPLRECVIFYRTNAQSRIFEDAFLKYQIPYVIIGGLSFYQRREIKDILALLRMVVSNADFLSFARTINLPKRGIGPTTLNKWRDLAEELALPILSLCRELMSGNVTQAPLTKKQEEGLRDYFGVLASLKSMCDERLPLEEIVQAAIEQSRYLDVLKADPETASDRKENLEALINKAAEWSEERETPTLIHFLEELSLKSSLDEAPEYDSVRLMTLHNGKGLEFDLTFIVGMEEDLFPHINSKDSIEALEEERRLCYVGMTRAKQFLYLTASTYRFMWGTPKVMVPSRFLKEVPPEYLTVLSAEEKEEEEFHFDEEEKMAIGTVVFHKDFGKGLIKKAYNTSLGVTYDVFFFESNMVRSLVGKYAKFKNLST
ncbi:MAG: UvrD-helicase domain-containing protein [Simkania sp.]|nr:UvrD-helicase domain-containing protein [Simkania sp.]MCB1075728.1 UvrD-helicase domain-containing protein [Simkania sp.]